jgi:signal transduction histidine kinase
LEDSVEPDSEETLEQVRQSRAHYQKLVGFATDAASCVVFLPDGTYRQEWKSGSLENELGFPMGSMQHIEDWFPLIHPDQQQEISYWYRRLEEENSINVDLCLRDAQGQYRWFILSAQIQRDPRTGARERMYTSVRDITGRVNAVQELRSQHEHLGELVAERTAKLTQANSELMSANQELERLHKQKDEFIARVSHDLRTPLVTGLGYLEMLLSGRLGELNPEAKEKLGIALRNLRRLSGMIDGILSFYRLSRRDVPYVPQMEPVDLMELLDECVDDYLVRTGRPDNTAVVRIRKDTPAVRGDKSLLRGIFANLLDNVARHAGLEASVAIDVRPTEAGSVHIEVKDDGPGIALEVAGDVFEPFVSSTRLGGGTGLGLPIVKAILEVHGSSPHLETAPGRGTTVWFDLAAHPG